LSLHNYLYCHTDPVSFIDPSGEFWIPILALLGSTLIGAGIGYYYDGWRGAAIGAGTGLGLSFMVLGGVGTFGAAASFASLGILGSVLYYYPLILAGYTTISAIGIASSFIGQGSLSGRLAATYCFRGMTALTGFGLFLTHLAGNDYEFTDDGSIEQLLLDHQDERNRWLLQYAKNIQGPYMSSWRKVYIRDFIETDLRFQIPTAQNFWVHGLGGLKVSGYYEVNVETNKIRNVKLTWIAWDGIDCNPDSGSIFYIPETVVMYIGDGLLNADYNITIRIPEHFEEEKQIPPW
jgi:hypothetical protein